MRKNEEILKIVEILENEKQTITRESRNQCNLKIQENLKQYGKEEIVKAYNYAIKCVLSEYVYCINNETS